MSDDAIELEADEVGLLGGKSSVGTLPQGYIRNVPLPRVPRGQSATTHRTVPTIPIVPDYYATPYVVSTYVSPRRIDKSATYAFTPAWQTIAINT